MGSQAHDLDLADNVAPLAFVQLFGGQRAAQSCARTSFPARSRAPAMTIRPPITAQAGRPNKRHQRLSARARCGQIETLDRIEYTREQAVPITMPTMKNRPSSRPDANPPPTCPGQ